MGGMSSGVVAGVDLDDRKDTAVVSGDSVRFAVTISHTGSFVSST